MCNFSQDEFHAVSRFELQLLQVSRFDLQLLQMQELLLLLRQLCCLCRT